MNEADARRVLFVRAVEVSDSSAKVLTADDRGYAGRAAAELVRWQAADKGHPATAEAYVGKRAELLTGKLAERSPRAIRLLDAMRWRPWIGMALPVIAFAIGIFAEHVADRSRVNILAFPLLVLIAWNLAVYLWLAVRALAVLASRGGGKPNAVHRLLAGARGDFVDRAAGPLAAAFAAFGHDWLKRSAPLVVARASRVLHVSAALLALGAIAGLFVRGLVFEYRAGWESTFLDAGAVHAILAFFLQPVALLIGQPFPGVEEIAALRWGRGATGENAGRWIHLYATAVMLAVFVPRLLLAGISAVRERALSEGFPLSLDEPYFRRVLSAWRESPAHVRVVPYAYTPSEAALEGLRRLAVSQLGDDVRVHPARTVAFGEEESAPPAPGTEAHATDLVVALFNLASTPETENHGVFLDTLKTQGALAVIVDETPFRQRLGSQAGADSRLEERRQAWTGLAATRDLQPVFADLESPDLAVAGRELEARLSGMRP